MVQITANSAQFVAGLNQANKKIGLIERSLSGLRNTLLGTFGAYQVIAAIQHAVSVLAEFDKTMTAVRVITGASGDDFLKLEKSAMRLGSTTQYTAKQVAELQLEFGRLGFSTREILQSTNAAVDLATATGEGLARSAEIAGSTMRAFNLDAKEMGRVTDVIAASLNRSALTLDSFADGIKYVAPVAAASGVTIEETAAMMSVLADAGIKGTQAGTSLRRIFTMLTADGRPLAEKLDELAKRGITLADANDEVGLYAQTALLVLGRYKEKVDELTVAYQEANGETDNMARAMEDNLGTAITKVSTAYDGLILSLKGSKNVLKEGADLISSYLRMMADDRVPAKVKFFGSNPMFAPLFSKLYGGQTIQQYLKNLERGTGAKGTFGFGDDLMLQMQKKQQGFSMLDPEILARVAHEQNLKKAIAAKVAAMESESEIESRLKTLRRERVDAAPEEQRLMDAEIALLERRLPVIRAMATAEAAWKKYKGMGQQDPFSNIYSDEIKAERDKPKSPMIDLLSNGSAITRLYNQMIEKELKLANIQAVKNKYAAEDMKIMETKFMYASMLGDAITRVIQRELEFGRAVAEVGARALDIIEQQIIANIMLGKAKLFAKNPVLGGIAAIFGFSLAKGFLRNISRGPRSGSGGVNYGGTAPRINSLGQAITLQGQVAVTGNQMNILLSNQNRFNKRTR